MNSDEKPTKYKIKLKDVKDAIDYLAKEITAGKITDPEMVKALAALIESIGPIFYYADDID